jgi:hypothetical protein
LEKTCKAIKAENRLKHKLPGIQIRHEEQLEEEGLITCQDLSKSIWILLLILSASKTLDCYLRG